MRGRAISPAVGAASAGLGLWVVAGALHSGQAASGCDVRRCCFPASGQCAELEPVTCTSAGGTPGSADSTCAEGECGPGACQIGETCAQSFLQVHCEEVYGGVYQGFGTECPDACPADLTDDELIGIADFLDLLSAWGPCPQREAPGSFAVPGRAVAEGGCAPRRCCLPDQGECTELDPFECALLGGTPGSAGEACSGNVCGPGACRLDGNECRVTFAELQCTDVLGGTWLGWGTTCPPECPADINGDSLVGINDLLDLLASWGPCPK